ncbi:MAG: hypothetical protein ACOX52_06365 [Verrucomicrobiota bacterium]
MIADEGSCESGSESGSGSGSIPALYGTRPSWTAQTSLPRCVSTATAPGFSCPNPIKRPFDTETVSDPDPGLALQLTFSHDLNPLGRRP